MTSPKIPAAKVPSTPRAPFPDKFKLSFNGGATTAILGSVTVLCIAAVAIVNSPNIVAIVSAAKGRDLDQGELGEPGQES